MKHHLFYKKILFRLRFLTYALIVSVSVNFAFLATFFIRSNLEKQKQITTLTAPLFQIENCETKQVFSNQNFFNEIKNCSFKELAALLTDKEQIEEGYTKRDLALACMVAFYDYNLEKIVSKRKLQKREIIFETDDNQTQSIVLFSGLNDFQYESIIYFAYTEKWPITTKGLFSLIKKNSDKYYADLLKTFMMSKEFELVRSLFEHHINKISNEKLLELLLK